MLDVEYYNYFEESNPDFNNTSFILESRNDPEMCSDKLIRNLAQLYLDNKKLPSGNILSLVSVEQTRDDRKRWFAKIQLHNENKKYLGTFGITSDYIGASINWALHAGISQKEIKEHLMISRTLMGHMIFPTWYSFLNEQSWNAYPEGISINIAKGGCKGYYDRIDLTMYALKRWYDDGAEDTRLKKSLDKNRFWLNQFCNFKEFIKFFNLNELCDDKYNIFNLTSFDIEAKQFKQILQNENVFIPRDIASYKCYMEGCNHFIGQRNLSLQSK